MSLSTVVIDDEVGLDAIQAEWDDLAIRAGKPFSAPAWTVAWWRNAAPKEAVARVVAIAEDDRLVGVAPLFTARSKRSRSIYEVMAARLSPPAGLLVEPGREAEVSKALMKALAGTRPKPLAIRHWDRTDESGLSKRLAAASGRQAWVHKASQTPLPVVVLDGLSYDDWLAKRSAKFRQESRRLRRRLEDAEARFGLAKPDDLDRMLDAFVELHGARWETRGGSNALIPGLKAMLTEVAAKLLPTGRLRIFTIEVQGRLIAINILLAAGGEVSGWNSGFDEEWSRYSPSLQLTLHAIADAAERGERKLNLGPGRMDYKLRLADGGEEVALTTLIPRDSAYPISRLRFFPRQLRGTVSRRLPDEAKQRLRRLAPH